MEIREEDLQIQTCPRCNGERMVWDPPPPARGTSRMVPCPECRGRGIKLTETGAKLFEFVRQVTRYGDYGPPYRTGE